MTVKQFCQQIAQQLQPDYESDEAMAVAYLMAEQILQVPRAALFSNSHCNPSPEQLDKTRGLVEELKQQKPVQYVLGNAWFFDLPLLVSPAVLIPRPETEELAAWIIQDWQQATTIELVDIGTGSGCLAIALAKHLPQAKVSAVEVSNEAISLAKLNADRLNLNIAFKNESLLNWQQWAVNPFDVIVSNPPYIPVSEIGNLDQRVTKWEPHLALFTPDQDPLIFYRALAQLGRKKLNAGGAIYVECNQYLAEETAECFIYEGFSTEIRKDFANNPRMIKAQ